GIERCDATLFQHRQENRASSRESGTKPRMRYTVIDEQHSSVAALLHSRVNNRVWIRREMGGECLLMTSGKDALMVALKVSGVSYDFGAGERVMLHGSIRVANGAESRPPKSRAVSCFFGMRRLESKVESAEFFPNAARR